MRAATLLLFIFSACRGPVELDTSLSTAVAGMRAALASRDHAAIWALTDTPTQTATLNLLRDADAARAQVPALWPETDHAAARDALGQALAASLGADDDGRGPRLLAATLDLGKLVFDEDTEQGLAARDVTIDPGPPRRALIATLAGERLSFVEDQGQWKSTLVRDLVLESATFQALTEHVKKAKALAEEQARVWQQSVDPKTPQGAYNLARAAQSRKPVDVDMLFALLDEDARKTLADILEASRTAQRQIQQRTVKAARREAYRNAGLLHLIDTTTDRELFKTWALGNTAKPLLAATDEPATLEGNPAEGRVTLVTQSGGRVEMHRDSDNFWRVGGLRTLLTEALGPRTTP